MKFYILNTKEEFDECQIVCFNWFIGYCNSESEIPYTETTFKWCEEQTRPTDGKYIVPYCDRLGDSVYTVEESLSGWFPEIILPE